MTRRTRAPMTRLDPAKTERYRNVRTGHMEIWAATSLDGAWAYQRVEDTNTPWDVKHVPTGTVTLGFTSLSDARRSTAVLDAVTGEDLRLCIDENCPSCGWPERWFSPALQLFGCPKCSYTSTERTA